MINHIAKRKFTFLSMFAMSNVADTVISVIRIMFVCSVLFYSS